jgi:hypothetical protein
MPYERPLQWMDLDVRGLDYVREQLKGINTLCNALLAVVDSEDGTTFTLAPIGTPHERLHQFTWGGILPENMENAHRAMAAPPTGRGHLVAVLSLRDEQDAWLAAELAKYPDGACIVDDVNPVWSDVVTRPYFANMPHAFGVDEEVYHLITRNEGAGGIANALDQGNALWHGVAAVCAELPIVTDRTSTREEIEKAARTVIAITCRAYDGEGFVCWQRL